MMAFKRDGNSWLMLARKLRLVLARNLQLAALVLDFLEQPHVLDCNDRLVGEWRDLIGLGLGIENLNRLTFERNAGDTSRTALKFESQHLRVLGGSPLAGCVLVDRVF